MDRPRTTRTAAPSRRLYTGLLPMVLGGAVFTLSCRLTTRTATVARISSDGTSAAARVFGDAAKAIGGSLYGKADVYFHGGIGPRREHAFENSVFQKLHQQISPSGHVHIHGTRLREIMPWLWMSMQMDPGHAETYLVAAFWLAGSIARPDLALEVLDRGQRNCPFNYEIQLAKGRIYLKHGQRDNAVQAFDAALAFWPGSTDPDTAPARQDKAQILLYRALLHEIVGEIPQAVARLREIVAMFPRRTGLQARMEALEAGTAPAALATSVWNTMLQQYSSEQASCHRTDEPHELHGNHEHSDEHGHEREHEH